MLYLASLVRLRFFRVRCFDRYEWRSTLPSRALRYAFQLAPCKQNWVGFLRSSRPGPFPFSLTSPNPQGPASFRAKWAFRESPSLPPLPAGRDGIHSISFVIKDGEVVGENEEDSWSGFSGYSQWEASWWEQEYINVHDAHGICCQLQQNLHLSSCNFRKFQLFSS